MPYFDHHWWLRAAAAAVAFLVSCAFPWRYLDVELPLDTRFGVPAGPDRVFAMALGGALLVSSGLLAYGSVRARDRFRGRIAALTGDIRPMPLARPSPERDVEPSASYEPLVIVVRADTFDRFVVAPFWLLLFTPAMAACALLLVGICAALATGNTHLLVSFFQNRRDTLPSPVGSMFAIMLFVAGFGILMLRWSWRQLFGTYTLTASDEGLRKETARGHTQLVRWNDARLFEVATFRRFQPSMGDTLRVRTCFRLYGREAAVCWDVDAPTWRPRVKLGDLPSIVQARTHLAPRTFSWSLRERGPLLPGTLWARPERLKLIAIGVFWLGYVVAVTGLVLAAAPTPVPMLNLLIRLSLIALLLFIAYAVVSGRRAFARLPTSARTALARPPIDPTASLIQTFMVRFHTARSTSAGSQIVWLARYALLFPLLTLDSIPVILLGYAPRVAVRVGDPTSAGWLTTLIAFALVPFGFMGIIGTLTTVVLVVLLMAGVIRVPARSSSH